MIMVQSQPRQIVHKNLSRKNPSQKRAGRMAQGVGPGFKPQYHKNKMKFIDLPKVIQLIIGRTGIETQAFFKISL
jgi:hypothetical protein